MTKLGKDDWFRSVDVSILPVPRIHPVEEHQRQKDPVRDERSKSRWSGSARNEEPVLVATTVQPRLCLLSLALVSGKEGKYPIIPVMNAILEGVWSVPRHNFALTMILPASPVAVLEIASTEGSVL
ncbi:uncharacterized protein SPSK_08084 [Sporothrix schenckii 1099-18]|uniref:Uncharacterized protein n=1 Tax=Sporothrix schenckii 1099-18 TaxID=1397361 RepID=A0A0F2MG17_SPOSC|nr:uncharacterized protein SPSK_08084 [Sporothrix schenckii 1099-18]KJR87999.1 hypothetical protein SPSK_08084 [Sporothrix schenckii 1099-18]